MFEFLFIEPVIAARGRGAMVKAHRIGAAQVEADAICEERLGPVTMDF